MTIRKMNTKLVSIIKPTVLEVKNSRTNSYCVTRLAYSPVDNGRDARVEFSTLSKIICDKRRSAKFKRRLTKQKEVCRTILKPSVRRLEG